MIRKLAIGIVLLGALVLIVGGGGAIAVMLTAPEPPPAGSASARRLAPGPFAVASRGYRFVDESRATDPNGDQPGASSRTLESLLWYPEPGPGDASPSHPLVVYSHGFMSMKEEATYLAEQLASYGYVVVSANYPLTNFGTPGGPNVADFINQPADVSFLIDSVLALSGDDKPFDGTIDSARIAAMGLSLGGLTTTLVAFHPELRDPRIRAAVSIAGPSSFFGRRFYETADLPFLMIAGTLDAMVDYGSHAQPVLERAPTGALVTIDRGSHTGFASFAEPFFRLVDHPDSVGCGALMENLDIQPDENPFAAIGGPEQGILSDAQGMLPCQGELSKAVHPGRQHMITSLAATAFLEGVFASNASKSAEAEAYLQGVLARDFERGELRPQRAVDL